MITVYDMTSGTLQKEPEAAGMEARQNPVAEHEMLQMPALQLHEENNRVETPKTIPASMLDMDCDLFVERMK
jgi:hypothetical protein